jgi:acetolactate synthase I/II/III large subunit
MDHREFVAPRCGGGGGALRDAVELADQRNTVLQQYESRLRQRHPVRAAHEELGTDLTLEDLDLLRQPGLRDLQSLGGSPEVEFLGQDREVAKASQIHSPTITDASRHRCLAIGPRGRVSATIVVMSRPAEKSDGPTVAEALATGLARHGITVVFGQSLPSALFLATPAHGIRQVAYRTENAGGAMADGYARVSGRIGVVAAQNGPAATLLVAPMAEALTASVPLLALVQDVPLANRDRNAFQEFDHTALFASCAKWVRRLDDPARVDDYLDAAVSVACSGRPGPVVLLLPRDVLTAVVPTPTVTRRASLGRFPLDRTRPPGDRVAAVAKLLRNASRPLVVAGGGVHLSGAAPALATLQAVASLPVGTTTMGKGSVDETDPLSLGVVSNYMGRGAMTHHLRGFVHDADVVLFVGTRTNENGTDGWRAFPRAATFVHIDVAGVEIGRNYEAVRLLGDARLTLEDLTAALRDGDLSHRDATRAGFVEEIETARNTARSELASTAASDAVPLRPERVVAELDDLLRQRDDVVVTADASYATIWMGNQLTSRRVGQRFLAPRGLAGLGWGLPLALGVSAFRPDSVVIALVGDGGFGHVWSELETAVRENLPIVVVVLNNGILGFQKHVELVQLGAHTSAVDFAPVDHAAVAEACGVRGVRVTAPDDLAPALAAAIDGGRPCLVEVMCDPDAFPPITAWEGRTDRIPNQTGEESDDILALDR